jgi:hypothetical protein
MTEGLEEISEAPIAPGTAVAAIALKMAMTFTGMSLVTDGILYQQYKLEGRNIASIDISWVFEVAIQIERHLLGGSDRIAEMLLEGISHNLIADSDDGDGDDDDGGAA